MKPRIASSPAARASGAAIPDATDRPWAHSAICFTSTLGIPIISQITRSGMTRAHSWTNSTVPPDRSTASHSSPATRSDTARISCTARGVNARLTSDRSRVCPGGFIITTLSRIQSTNAPSVQPCISK